MTRRRVWVGWRAWAAQAAVAGVAVVGCGGGSEPAAAPSSVTSSAPAATTTSAPPTTTSTVVTTTTTPRFPGQERLVDASGSPITMYYDAGVPVAEVNLIEESVKWARQDHGDSGPLRVFVYSNPQDILAAYALGGCGASLASFERNLPSLSGHACRGQIWQYRPDPPNPRPMTAQSVSHEYFHTVQEAKRNRTITNQLPVWLAEGSADFFTYTVLDNRRFVTSRTVPAGETLRVNYGHAVMQTRSAGPLQTFERTATIAIGREFAAPLGLIASRYIVDRFGGEKLRTEFWSMLSTDRDDWQRAFPVVFGISLEQFYADFEEHRKTL